MRRCCLPVRQELAGHGRLQSEPDFPSCPRFSLLQEASEHGRMQSETYLRLNLGLLWWGLGSALALWLAPAQPLRMGQG